MIELNDAALFRQACYIDGQWLESADRIDVHNPFNGECIGHIPSMTTADVQKAIDAAERAQVAWAAKTAAERSKVLRRWFELLMENQDDLAKIMTVEQGKPLKESKGEIAYAASFVEWFAEEAKRIYGDTIPHKAPGTRITVIKQPVGVCAAITPWNFPAAMITRKAAPALAAGCAMIVKPATQTPFSALALAELAERAGVPAGVFNVITGESAPLGEALCDSEKVRKLSFTGSTRVGSILMKQCADTVKRLSMELGGNAPFIVFDDADLDLAVDGLIASKYRNAGQTCICANRIYVQNGVYDAFVSKFKAAAAKLKVGNGLEDGTDIGPLIDQNAVKKVSELLDDALEKGAECVLGGELSDLGELVMQPTILTNIQDDMTIAHEEIFGPITAIQRFESEEEVIQRANDTPFGLASYFYSEGVRRSIRVMEGLQYGMVGHNTGLISNEVAPFGGVKQSGFGREGSKYGIEEYVSIKYCCSAV